jgi:hypothetical protein
MKRIIISAGLLLSLSACYNDKAELLYPPDLCQADSVTFSGVIGPILVQNCATENGCHKTPDAPAAAGVSLDNLAGAQAVAQNGKLLRVINHDPTISAMPKNKAKLDDCTIRKISKWVADGHPNN